LIVSGNQYLNWFNFYRFPHCPVAQELRHCLQTTSLISDSCLTVQILCKDSCCTIICIHLFVYCKEPRYVVVPVGPHARHNDTRLCLAQKTHGGLHSDVWALDSLRLMPITPTSVRFHVQFSLHLMCGLNARRGSNNRYSVALCVKII